MATRLATMKVPHQQNLSSDEYLNSKEAAALLKISRSTLYKQVRKIPHSKLGKGLLFKRSVLLHLIEEARVPTDAELLE